MAKFNNGILGPLNGKIGAVVGSNWRGISYLRSKPRRSKKAASVKQQQQRMKFGLVVRFARPMAALLNKVFLSGADKMTGVNAATASIINTAIKGEFPNYELDYSLVKIGRGNLPNIAGPRVTTAGGVLTVGWKNNTGIGKSADTDRSVILVYCPAQRQAIYNFQGAPRNAGTQDMQVWQFGGEDVHVYISFVTADGSDAADSIYLGKFTLENIA